MSLTLTLSGKSSTLSVNYFPALDLSDGDYELGLTHFETYNTIPNVDSTNNKFYFDDNDEEITIPVGTYELKAIARHLKKAVLRKRRPKTSEEDDFGSAEEDDKTERLFVLRANENTMRCELWSAYRVNFAKPNTVGSLLGFSSDRVLKPRRWYESDKPVNIMFINVIRVECNITAGAYSNDKPAHIIHEFAPNVAPGYKLTEKPTQIIYLPVITKYVTEITVRIVDQNDRPINFRGEEITIRLHVRRRRSS